MYIGCTQILQHFIQGITASTGPGIHRDPETSLLGTVRTTVPFLVQQRNLISYE
jgi:hypothetical protein